MSSTTRNLAEQAYNNNRLCSPLINLPREIRDMISAYTWSHTPLITFTHKGFLVQAYDKNHTDPYAQDQPSSTQNNNNNNNNQKPPSWITSSSQIFFESLAYFSKTYTFTLATHVYQPYSLVSAAQRNKFLIACARKVHVEFEVGDFTRRTKASLILRRVGRVYPNFLDVIERFHSAHGLLAHSDFPRRNASTPPSISVRIHWQLRSLLRPVWWDGVMGWLRYRCLSVDVRVRVRDIVPRQSNGLGALARIGQLVAEKAEIQRQRELEIACSILKERVSRAIARDTTHTRVKVMNEIMGERTMEDSWNLEVGNICWEEKVWEGRVGASKWVG